MCPQAVSLILGALLSMSVYFCAFQTEGRKGMGLIMKKGASSRISRTGFWKRIIPLPIVGFILLQLDFLMQTGAWGIAPSGPALLFYWTLIGVVIFIVACVKRAHDRNKSGWWTLLYILPYIGWLWAFIELGFFEGTKGPNRFGPDPRNGV